MAGYSGTPLVKKLGLKAGMRVRLNDPPDGYWGLLGGTPEIGRSEVMAAGKALGLVDVKVCAVDETWSGLKFVIPRAERRG